MKSLAIIIHARTQSTRCPNKHLRDLGDGNTLIDIAINNLSKLSNVEEKYLAAYDIDLIKKANNKIDVLLRSYEAVAPGNCHHSVMYDHLNAVDSDYIINYNPCQPFLNIDKLQKVIDWFKATTYESAITVKQKRNFFWDSRKIPINFKPNDRLSTTSGPFLWEATHSLVMYKRSYMLENWELFPNLYNEPYPYLIDWDDNELVDVDTELDFKLVKTLYNEVRN
jgi:CMP-N-acetylneuraminic acid synthetase